MGKTRNIFAIVVGRYNKSPSEQRKQFHNAKNIWQSAAVEILCA
jgi:putative transposase